MNRKIFMALIFVMLIAGFAYGADGDKVLARVNSQDITEREVLQFIQPFGQQALMLYGTEQGRKMILEDVITMRLYALDGEDQKLYEAPEFQETLANTRRVMLAQAAMRNAIKDVTISDDEAKKFYDDNPRVFTQPEKIHARHILVSGDENLARVQELLKAGTSFDVVAKEHSIDPGSAANGGDLGEFPRGVMVKEFEDAAFNLREPGEISAPVKTQFGWHIIKLEDRIPEATTPFEQVKPQVLQELQERKTQDILKNRSEELEKVYKVERF